MSAMSLTIAVTHPGISLFQVLRTHVHNPVRFNLLISTHLDETGLAGKGESGMGRAKGKSAFDAFTHRKTVAIQVPNFDPLIKYPPYKVSALRKRKCRMQVQLVWARFRINLQKLVRHLLFLSCSMGRTRFKYLLVGIGVGWGPSEFREYRQMRFDWLIGTLHMT